MCRVVEASDGAGMVRCSAQLEELALRVHTMIGANRWVEAGVLHACSTEAELAADADPKLRKGKVGRGQGGTQVSANANTCGTKRSDICRGSSITMHT